MATITTLTSPHLFEPNDPQRPGYVSAACRYVDEGEQRIVLVWEQPLYLYDRRDRLARRQTWVNVYESGYATHRQIAQANGIGVRTIELWVNRYRANGAEGLLDRARSGAPRKVTEPMRRRIYRLRDGRASVREVAARCGISVSAVAAALRQRRQAVAQRQCSLPEGSTLPPVSAPAAVVAVQVPEPTAPAAVATAEPGTPANAGASGQVGPELAGVGSRRAVVESSVAQAQSEPTVAVQTAAATAVPEERTEKAASAGPELAEAAEAAAAPDRAEDRLWARLGMLQDADPYFAPGEKVEWAGAFLAVALLATDPYLAVARRVYGQFAASFYGTRTIMLTLVLMALLRLKRPQDLRRDDPVKLGRVLGLDRAPEVKTVRRKLHQWETLGRAAEFMRQLAESRVQEYQDPIRTVLIDGHVQIYSGQVKIGQTYAPTRGRVLKAHTDTWVNLPGQWPLFTISSDFNEGLSEVLPAVAAQARAVLGVESLTCVFDRGGYYALLFERLMAAGFGFITYRRGRVEPVAETCFRRELTCIGNRMYEFAPYERQIELAVYEPVSRGPGRRPGYRNSKRKLRLREVRLRREDGGQTAILTSHLTGLSASEIAACIIERWGSQENLFKYLLEEFDLDGLYSYGAEDIAAELDHPNPAYVKLEKQAAKLRRQRTQQLAKMGERAAAGTATAQDPGREAAVDRGRAEELARVEARLAEVTAQLAETPARERLSAAGYRRLKNEVKQLLNAVRLTAYRIETKLVDMLRPAYANTANDGRRLLAAALRTSGSLRLEPGRLVIRLEPQSCPCRTRAINELAQHLTQLQVRYPGSRRVLVFEPTPVPPAPDTAPAQPPHA